MTVYIKAKSKAEINRALKDGSRVSATEYKLTSVSTYSFEDLPDGTCVKIFEKFIDGNPYAKSYGTKKGSKLI